MNLPKKSIVPVLQTTYGILLSGQWKKPGTESPDALSLVEALNLGARIHVEGLEAELTFQDIWHRPMEERLQEFLEEAGRELGVTTGLPLKNGSDYNRLEHFSALPTTTHNAVLILIEATIRRIMSIGVVPRAISTALG